jgi:hypothetical protein
VIDQRFAHSEIGQAVIGYQGHRHFVLAHGFPLAMNKNANVGETELFTSVPIIYVWV